MKGEGKNDCRQNEWMNEWMNERLAIGAMFTKVLKCSPDDESWNFGEALVGNQC